MKSINKICSCGKKIESSTRKRYCPECVILKKKLTTFRTQRRNRLKLPNLCNVCNKEIPANKQKCKQCLGYNKICVACQIKFNTNKKHQKFCKPRCYYDYITDGLTKEKKTNQDYQDLLIKYEALQYSYNILEAVDKTNVLLLDKYREDNEMMKKELEWVKSTEHTS